MNEWDLATIDCYGVDFAPRCQADCVIAVVCGCVFVGEGVHGSDGNHDLRLP